MTSLSRGFQEHAPRRRTRAAVGAQVEIPAVCDPRARCRRAAPGNRRRRARANPFRRLGTQGTVHRFLNRHAFAGRSIQVGTFPAMRIL